MFLEKQQKVAIPIDISLRDSDLGAISKDIRAQVFEWLLQTRPEKFKKFLKMLNLFRYGVCSCVRGDLMEFYYCAMRFPDDVGDGDHPLPEGYASRPDYVAAKLEFARNPQNPKDAIDQVLLYCYQMAEKLGFSLQKESADMLESILFDAHRRGMNAVFPRAVLNKNFYRLDIDGTESASLKIFGEDPSRVASLNGLGIATRMYYNLRDFRSDNDEHGLINIAEEDMEELGMGIDDLSNPDAAGVRRWFQKEAMQGIDLIRKHKANPIHASLKRVTQFTLNKVYVHPAEKFFGNILHPKQ